VVLTGQTLYTYNSGLSGSLYTTGSNLYQQINLLSGYCNEIFAPLSGSGGNTRYVYTSGWQFFNSTTNLWHTLLCIGNPPTFAFDSGSH
jgi:hypothetical protein